MMMMKNLLLPSVQLRSKMRAFVTLSETELSKNLRLFGFLRNTYG